MSRVTLPVLLIAAAAAWPAGASASVGFVPSAPPAGMADQQSVGGHDTARDADAPVEPEAVIAIGLLGMAGGTLLLASRTRRPAA